MSEENPPATDPAPVNQPPVNDPPNPPPTPPATDSDRPVSQSEFTNFATGVTETLTGITETLASLISNKKIADETPVKVPWTHRGGKR